MLRKKTTSAMFIYGFIILTGLWVGADDVPDVEIVNPIAVPGVEAGSRILKAQQSESITSFEELPAIGYIRKEIPKAKYPMIDGDYYETLSPDTCNLEERASVMSSIKCRIEPT